MSAVKSTVYLMVYTKVPMELSSEKKTYSTDTPHRVMDPPRPQTPLYDFKAAALTEDDVRCRHAHIFKLDVCVAVRSVVVAEHRQHALDGYAGGVGGNKDDGLLAVGAWLDTLFFIFRGSCPAHDNVELAAGIAGAA